MAPSQHKPTGCWTCRIRRKKCDKGLPACRGCEALEISCYYEESKPEWMDSGIMQQKMRQKIKAEIKRNANRRRSRRKIQIITRDIDEASFGSSSHVGHVLPCLALSTAPIRTSPSPRIPSVSGSNLYGSNDSTGSALASEVRPHVTSLHVTSSSYERSSHLSLSGNRPVQQDSANSSAQEAPLSDLSLPNQLELTFVMAYLDYVFPVSFPFFRPTILEGGRSWLLSAILRNKCLHHTAISLTSYFFSVVDVNPGSANQICGSYTWEALQHQTQLALKKARRDLDEIGRNGVQENLLKSAHLIASVVHLLSVEVILGSNDNWKMHLDAASLLFQQLLGSYGKDEPYAAFSLIIQLIGGLPFNDPPERRLWSPDQAAFRFFSTILIFNDILASTSLEQPPKLRGCYIQLLGNDFHTEPEPEPSLQLSDVVGCQNWALIAIGEIAALDAWKKSMKEAGKLSITELVKRGAVINQLLQHRLAALDTYQQPYGQKKNVSITQLETLSCHPPCASNTVNTITRIWALSARSYLLITISGWQLANAELRTNVAQTIGLLTEIAASPTWIRTLAWPLCVAGCLSSVDEEVLVRRLLTEMGSLQAFGTLNQALSIMENVWRNRTQIDAETWDLAACLRCLGHLVLLV